jgi:hypothetical protein
MPSEAVFAMQDNTVRTARYSPDATAFEAFSLATYERTGPSTKLLDPLAATSLNDALAEATHRWAWDRGDRIGIREISQDRDWLHIYAARRKSQGVRVVRSHLPSTEYRRWLEHICTIDLNTVAGIPVGCIGSEFDLHMRRQHQRPEGARLERDSL